MSTTESATLPEILALKAIVRVLLGEKIAECKDENAATFEIAAICSEIVNESQPGGPDPERVKQSAQRHLDDIFGDLKRVRNNA
jgi:hypothetical protein